MNKRFAKSGLNYKMHHGGLKEGMDAPITVTSYHWFISQLKNGNIKKEEVGFVVADEGHEMQGRERRGQLQEIMNLGINVVGFTATPDHSKRKTLKKFLGHEYCRILVKEAAEQGLISNFRCVFAITETDLSNVKIESDGEYNNEEYVEAISNERRMQSAWEFFKQHLINKKGIFFANRIKAAENLWKYFNQKAEEEGLDARFGFSIGAMDSVDRRREKENWDEGYVKAIFGVRSIAQGVSFDGGDYIVCIDGVFSPILHGQRCGRSLGIDHSRLDRIVEIIEFIDKDTKRGELPITYPQIVQTSEVIRKTNAPTDTQTAMTPYAKAEMMKKMLEQPKKEVEIKVEGLKVIMDAGEVMEIIANRERQFNLSVRNLFGPEELLEQIKTINPKPTSVWYKAYVEDIRNIRNTIGWPISLQHTL
jgi:superfamily II DNA or RNA helicase